MELAFDSKALRTICESQVHAKRALGAEVAEVLKRRLADLRAATSPKDLVVGRPRELAGAGPPHMAVDLCGGYHIVFSANHSRNSLAETGYLDWLRVSRIKILRIESDHG